MHIILDEAGPGDRKIECRHCHWQGTVNEVKKGDYLLLSSITEVYCPACGSYLGFIQHNSHGEKQTDL
jgi:hypothetical protein